MKITIDTKEDSHEEIQRVIKMLSSLVGEEMMSNQGDIFSDSSSESKSSDMFSDESSKTEGSDIFNMFGSSESSNSETKTEDTEEKKEEKDDVDIDIPEVREYH